MTDRPACGQTGEKAFFPCCPQGFSTLPGHRKEPVVDNGPCAGMAVDIPWIFRPWNLRNFFDFSLLHKSASRDQKSFLPDGRSAFGWLMDNPSKSQRNSCRVSSLACEGSLGHWNRPLSRRFCIRTKPVLSKYRAFKVLCFLPQNRYRAFAYGSSW